MPQWLKLSHQIRQESKLSGIYFNHKKQKKTKTTIHKKTNKCHKGQSLHNQYKHMATFQSSPHQVLWAIKENLQTGWQKTKDLPLWQKQTENTI